MTGKWGGFHASSVGGSVVLKITSSSKYEAMKELVKVAYREDILVGFILPNFDLAFRP